MIRKTSAPLSFTSYYDTPRSSKYIGLFLLLALLLPASLAWATPPDQPSWKQNMKASVELGFGLPYAWIVGADTNRSVRWCSVGKLDASPNVRLGAVWGYGFPLDYDFQLGPEVGLAYSMTQRVMLPLWGVTIEEQYLQIPVGIKVTFPTQWDVIRQGITLGYEFNILLSSKYKQSGGRVLPDASWKGNKDLKEAIPDLSKLTGSIFLDSTIDFPKGFYFMMRVRFPVVDFLGLKKYDRKNSEGSFQKELDNNFMHLARIGSASWVEVNVGVDIMKWL